MHSESLACSQSCGAAGSFQGELAEFHTPKAKGIETRTHTVASISHAASGLPKAISVTMPRLPWEGEQTKSDTHPETAPRAAVIRRDEE